MTTWVGSNDINQKGKEKHENARNYVADSPQLIVGDVNLYASTTSCCVKSLRSKKRRRDRRSSADVVRKNLRCGLEMAYRVTIEDDFDREPLVDAFNSYSIRFILGDDLAADIVVFMAVEFTLIENAIYDLRFGTEEQELSREGWSFGLDYSIEYSKRYVPKEFRLQVLNLVLTAIESILVKCGAKKVTMQSFYKNLPAKAFVKYEKIAEIMKKNGFETTSHFQANGGIFYWQFEKNS